MGSLLPSNSASDYSERTKTMASFRALLIVAMIACVVLLRSADAVVAPAPSPSVSTKAGGVQHCDANNKTCRPGDQSPENQEEEAVSVNVPPALIGGDNSMWKRCR